jgi:hypothetical protein
VLPPLQQARSDFEGELTSLTPEDADVARATVTINAINGTESPPAHPVN